MSSRHHHVLCSADDGDDNNDVDDDDDDNTPQSVSHCVFGRHTVDSSYVQGDDDAIYDTTRRRQSAEYSLIIMECTLWVYGVCLYVLFGANLFTFTV